MRRTRMWLLALALGVLALQALTLLACDPDNEALADVLEGDDVPESVGLDVAVGSCKGTYPMSQGPTEPCCPEWSIDACGAGLFCAAFDGRRQPTCYQERSRLGGQECTGDNQCALGACNRTARRCHYGPGETCTVAAGCTGGTICLADAEGARTCRPDDEQGSGEGCEENEHCRNGDCNLTERRCRYDEGEACDPAVGCVAGHTCGGPAPDAPQICVPANPG